MGLGHLLTHTHSMTQPLASFGVDEYRRAVDYAENLSPEGKQLAQTWLVSEAVLTGLYYLLFAWVVFFLGRRIIQAMIAAYREARAESV